MVFKTKTYLEFFLVFAVFWASFGGVAVFWFPLNEFGEFSVPKSILLTGDVVLFLVSIPAVIFMGGKVRLNEAIVSALAFIFVCALASAKTLLEVGVIEYFHYFVRNLLFYFIIGLVVLCASQVVDNSFHERLVKVLVGGVVFSSLIICISYLAGHKEFFWEGSRLTGTLINHNSFAFVCVFMLFWSFSEKKYFLSVILSALIVLSGSLTGMLSFAFLALLKPVQGALAASFLLLFLVFGYSAFPELHFFYKVEQLFLGEETHLTSLSARQGQLDWFLDNFLVSPSAWPVGVLNIDSFGRFDSQYYNVAVNFGLFALLAFAGMCFEFYRLSRSKAVRLYLLWCVVAFSLTAFLSRWNLVIMFFYFVGYGISLGRCSGQAASKESSVLEGK